MLPTVSSRRIVDTGPVARAPFSLHPNRPNPFDLATEISFDLPTAARIDLEVLDVAGRKVRSLAGGVLSAGPHRVTWDGTNAASERVAAGVYFFRLESEGASEIRRMVLLK